MTDAKRINDGGPAFPIPGSDLCGTYEPASGMSLRQWYAGKIAAGILAGGWADTVPLDGVDHARQLAEFAFAGADALIEKGGE
jgi:hypothetical protein